MSLDTHAPTTAPTRPWPRGLETIAYGGDYNPEQWPRSTWAQDVDLMREAGVNLVSVGVFSWAMSEPAEGVLDFAWLDEVMDLLWAGGIHVDLGTPTAAPPAWFHAAHPETRVRTREGLVLSPGSRGICCPSAPAYAAASARITTALARRYADHPALSMWHVHNEYGAPVAECYCETSAAAFRAWLAARYGQVEALNEAWGTAFWGLRYTSFDQIGAPGVSASVVNPAHRLDFARFSDHELRACFRRERDILHTLSPGVPVTTNFMVTQCPAVDYWAWAREVDVVADDHYLQAADPRSQVNLALAADLTRSLAGNRPWLVMEHSTSGVSWQGHNPAKRPGEMARNSVAHVARGADGTLFFQWRASRAGAEKFHSGMLPHGGTDTRVWREVVDLGRELGALRELLGSRVRARAAIVWDWVSQWAQALEWRPSDLLSATERTRAYYEWLWDRGVTCDFVHPEAELAGYDLVVLPAGYMLTADGGANLAAFVARGGTLVVSGFSGVVDANDTVHPGGAPGPLSGTLGLRVEEFTPVPLGERVHLAPAQDMGSPDPTGARSGGGSEDGPGAEIWAEDLALSTARGVWLYADGPVPGGAAVTCNDYGCGQAWYVSTLLGPEDLTAVLEPALERAGLADPAPARDLELVVRSGDGADFLLALNHSPEPRAVPVAGVDLRTGAPVTAPLLPGGAWGAYRIAPPEDRAGEA